MLTHEPEAASVQLRPPYGWAAFAAGAVLALYVITLAPTTAFWDASEYIAVANILGIPHPPGNPLFVVLARAWTALLEPTGLSVAVRVNLLSAVVSATAHGLWFLSIHHVLRRFSDERAFALLGAGVAVLLSATAFTVWNQSNVNEKVYTVSLLTIALLTWIAILWKDRVGRPGSSNLLVLMAFVLALSVGNHLMAFLAAPALALFVLRNGRAALLEWRLWPSLAGVALLGLSIHLFLPVRAELGPVINQGAPECASIAQAAVSVATYGSMGCEELSATIRREQYTAAGEPGPGLVGPRQAPLSAQSLNYLQYFDWQWGRSLDGADTTFPPSRLPFSLLFAFLGIRGMSELHRRDREAFWYFGTLFLTLSAALVYYLNFETGYSLPAPAGVGREVRERDYFFVVSFSVWGLLGGIGLATLWREASRALQVPLLRAAPILAIGLVPLVANWSWASRADDWMARDYAHDLLMSVEPYGVLFTNGDNDTFPLWYLQEVEGIRQDVTVIVTTYFNTPWYARQLRDLTVPCDGVGAPQRRDTLIECQRVYSADNTDSMYVDDPADAGEKVALLLDRPLVMPARSILPVDDTTVDRVSQTYFRLASEQTLLLGPATARLQAGQLVWPWMQYALTLIHESIAERPIHFSSNGGAAAELGLSDQLVRQGLAFKLVGGPASASRADDVLLSDSPYLPATGRRVDLARTQLLLDEAFVRRPGVPDSWPHWPDRPSIGIPNFYSWAYLAAALGAQQVGDGASANRFVERSQAWTRLGTSD
jgi:hypothetical protein